VVGGTVVVVVAVVVVVVVDVVVVVGRTDVVVRSVTASGSLVELSLVTDGRSFCGS
jgi:hypothetical protein